MGKFRKRPIVIEAAQWLGYMTPELFEFLALGCSYILENDCLTIRTMEGDMTANVGDWILRGVCDEFYPCRKDIFEQTYEKVEDA